MGQAKMKLPTQKALDQAAEAFDRNWGGVDEVLYGICRESPDHSLRRDVTRKAALIGRAYSAGLERQVQPDPGDQAITKIADFLMARAADVDGIISGLNGLCEPLDEPSMTRIVACHGRFTTLLSALTTKHGSPRSFAAKYLHFHRPVVPIYDSYAAARLIKLVRWDSRKTPFEQPLGADGDYWDFCARFLRLYEACRKADLAVSVKVLDTYLWAVPGAT